MTDAEPSSTLAPSSTPARDEPLLHAAARAEDAVHHLRARFGRARGLRTTLIPYPGYGASGWVRILGRVLLTRPSRTRKYQSRYANVRGWRSFLSIPIDDVEVIVRIGGREHVVPPSRGGVVDVRLEADLEPGWHTVTMRTAHTEPVEASVFIVSPEARFGLVSDIDDTVMVTALPRPFLAAWNTFVLNEHARTPVAGMAVLYERITRSHPTAPVIYLSTGAWNVAPTLLRFLSRNLYPRGPLLLTDWGPTHDRWFRSGREHKEQSLRRLAGEFPDIRWLLVGDDGQHDESIYGAFAEEHPTHVAAVAIRQLSSSEAVLAGGRSKPREHPGPDMPWVYAPDGAGLDDQLAEHGLTRSAPGAALDDSAHGPTRPEGS